MKINDINSAYASKFDQEISSYIDKHNTQLQSDRSYMHDNGYYITFIFKRNLKLAFTAGEGRSNPQFQNLNLFYNLMCRELLGRRYGQHRDQQPLVIAALDVNGTRVYSWVQSAENIHIHSIWAVPPHLNLRFISTLFKMQELSQLEKTDIQRIDVRPIKNFHSEAGSPTHLSQYTSKFLGQNSQRLLVEGDDWRQYPLPKTLKVKHDHSQRPKRSRNNSEVHDRLVLPVKENDHAQIVTAVGVTQAFETLEINFDPFQQPGYWEAVFHEFEEMQRLEKMSEYSMRNASVKIAWPPSVSKTFGPVEMKVSDAGMDRIRAIRREETAITFAALFENEPLSSTAVMA